MSDPPEWIFDQVQAARELFGVGGAEWSVIVELNDRPNGSDEYDGTTYVDARYLNATIEIRRGLRDNEEGRRTIFHEVLHIPLQEVNDVALDAIERLPGPEKEIYRELYKTAVERFIQRISRNILARLKPADGGDNVATG